MLSVRVFHACGVVGLVNARDKSLLCVPFFENVTKFFLFLLPVSAVGLHVKTRITNKHNNKSSKIYRLLEQRLYDIRQRLIAQFRVYNNIWLEYRHSTEYSQSEYRKSVSWTNRERKFQGHFALRSESSRSELAILAVACGRKGCESKMDCPLLWTRAKV